MANIGFKEDLFHEFKSDKKKLPDKDMIDVVVAFANTNGGELYLGVEDNGEITGLHAHHHDITRMAAMVANNTVPPVMVHGEIMDFEIPVMKITVPQSTSIVASSSGKIQRRILNADGTPANVPMYPHQIQSRLTSLSLLDYSAQPVPNTCLQDFDPLERERLRNIIRTYRGEQALLELADTDFDKALYFVAENGAELVPTYCGLLLMGRKEAIRKHIPTAESAIQVLEGTDIRVNESFYLPLASAFEKISEYFQAWNRQQELEHGLFRVSVPDYDPRAFREALVNAFSHRDFTRLGRVLIQINDDGMKISNPGGFIEGITSENLIDAAPHGRNPALADALKRIGLAERTGRGIDRIFEGSLLYGRMQPDFSESTAVNVDLFIPKGPTDPSFIQMISEEQRRTGRTLSIHSLLVMNSLRRLNKAKTSDIVTDLRIGETRVRVALEQLVNTGLIEARGVGNGRHYLLGEKYYKYTRNMPALIRQTDIPQIRYRELVLELVRKSGAIKRSDVMELLRISPSQANRLLTSLVKEKILIVSGKSRATRYTLR